MIVTVKKFSHNFCYEYLLLPTFLIWLVGCLLFSNDVKAQTTTIPNFHKVDTNIYRGASPRQHGIEELKKLGIKTIVNLERELFEEEPGEVRKERQWAEKAGIKFIHVPMHPIFAPKVEDIEKALAYITNPANQPVFVHCERGSDRTGIVIAAYRIRYGGWTVEQTYEEMKRYGHMSILLFWWKDILYEFK